MWQNKLQATTLHTHVPAHKQQLHESEYAERDTSMHAPPLALGAVSFRITVIVAAADALADAPATQRHSTPAPVTRCALNM